LSKKNANLIDKYNAKSPAVLKAYKPSLRDKAQIAAEGLFERVAGREPGYGARQNISNLTGLLDFVPGVGETLGVDETKRAFDRKRYLEAGLTGAGTALGIVPVVGDAAGKGVKNFAKLVSKYGVDSPKVKIDNPGGDWLASKQRYAEEDMARAARSGYAPGAARGPVTGYLDKPVLIDPAKLSKIPGAMLEVPKPGNPKYDALMKSMSKKGYDPDEGGAILVGVNHRGEPHIIEGNNRAAVAKALGLPAIPAEIRWYAGGEQSKGVLSPDKIADYLYKP
jgi:hypothetical protein